MSITSASLTCNGVEFSIGDIITAFPIDVCHGQFINGAHTKTEYKCINNQIYWTLYTSQDCDGYPSSQQTFASLYPTADYINQYCNLNIECQYIKTRKYDETFINKQDCDSFNLQNSDYTEMVYVEAFCNQLSSTQSFTFTCNTTSCTEKVYSSPDCDPLFLSAFQTYPKSIRHCRFNHNIYEAYEIVHGPAVITTSPTAAPSAEIISTSSIPITTTTTLPSTSTNDATTTNRMTTTDGRTTTEDMTTTDDIVTTTNDATTSTITTQMASTSLPELRCNGFEYTISGVCSVILYVYIFL